MVPRSPQEAHTLWADRLTAGDLDGLVRLYEPDAVLVPQPGTTVTGHAAIREALSGLLALKPDFHLDFQSALEAGGLALLYSRWTLNGTAADGSALTLTSQTSDVVRRQEDGSWLFVIDNPFGGHGVDVAAA